MQGKIGLIGLALTGLLIVGGCDLFDDEDIPEAGSAKASQDYSGTYVGFINGGPADIETLILFHEYDSTYPSATPVRITDDCGGSYSGHISSNKIVANGTDVGGGQVTITGVFSGTYLDGFWQESGRTGPISFTMTKI